MNTIEILERQTVPCSTCEGDLEMTVLVMKDTTPHKIITSSICETCKKTEIGEEDLVRLGYGVSITAHFTEADKSRIIFINSKTTVKFFKEETMVFEISFGTCFIDCVEGLLERAADTMNVADNAGVNEYLKEVGNGMKFSIEISDKSGYSKICPMGVEYTEIMDLSIEEIQEKTPEFKYTKLEHPTVEE